MQQQRSSDTREKIVHTAQGLFSTHGYDATGVAQICADAGVSKGAFYHHFPSKHAVFMAILHAWLDKLDHQFIFAEGNGSDVPSLIHQMTASSDAIFADSQGQFPMFLEFWEKSIRDERVWEETKQPFLKYYFYFSQLLKRGMEAGSIKKMDANTASRALIGLAIGIILQGLLYPQDADWKKELQDSIDLLLRGMQNG